MREFVDYLDEVFEQLGEIRSRKMFGGYGVYHNDLMFGLVADNVLYLKADSESSAAFTELGLGPFQYVKSGKRMDMSYFQAPEAVFDDPDEAKAWADLAIEAALRAKAPKKKRR